MTVHVGWVFLAFGLGFLAGGLLFATAKRDDTDKPT